MLAKTILTAAGILFSLARVYKFLAELKVGFTVWMLVASLSLNLLLQRVNYMPGFRPLFSPLSLFGAIIPSTWWNPGLNWSWNQRRTCTLFIPFRFLSRY